jgi:hypothetical protein
VQALFQRRFRRVGVGGHEDHLSRWPWRSRRVLLPPGGRMRHNEQMPMISPYQIALTGEEQSV